MSRRLKIFLSGILGMIIIVTLFFYFSLYGLPIKKSSIANTVQKHLEEKYETNVELVGAVYNFQDKNYGGVFKIDDIEFYAEKISKKDGEFLDTYPQEIWTRQIVTDYKDVYKKVFPRAIRIQANFNDYVEPIIEGPKIPRYDEIDSSLTLNLTIDEALKEEHWEGILDITQSLQEKSPRITSAFLFIEEAKDRETLITCPEQKEQNIQSIDEAKTSCEQTVLTGDERTES